MNTYNVTIQVTGDDSHEAMDKVRVIERILDQARHENLFYIYDDSEQFDFDLTVNPAPNPEPKAMSSWDAKGDDWYL